MYTRAAAVILATAALHGCQGDAPRALEPSAAMPTPAVAAEGPTYVDAVETLPTREDRARWYGMIRALEKEFNDICGDTLCEGQYADIVPMFFRCSAAKATGELRSCIWVFGEAQWDLDATTGAVTVPDRRVAVCTIPVAGTAAALVDAIHGLGDRPPGTSTSISEALAGCL